MEKPKGPVLDGVKTAAKGRPQSKDRGWGKHGEGPLNNQLWCQADQHLADNSQGLGRHELGGTRNKKKAGVRVKIRKENDNQK